MPQAFGFLIDTKLIGVAEATHRVIEYWQDGARLGATPDGSWLLSLPDPVTVRLDRAPGLALSRPALTGYTLSEVELPFRLDLPVYALSPLEVAPPAEILADPAPVTAPDLRGAAGIGPARRRFLSFLTSKPFDTVWRVVLIVAVVLLCAIAVYYGRNVIPQGFGFFALLLGLLAGYLSLRRGRGSGRAATGRSSDRGPGQAVTAPVRPPGRFQGWLSLAAFASPFGRLFARRHLAYLSRIERAFRERQWERALREAIPLGGAGGILSLSLPKAWQGRLSPSLTERGGGRALGIGRIDAVFTDIYRKAAAELEKAGQIEKAAYVLADLLDSSTDAVQLLERHKMYLLAARLAEGRSLEPALVVRLWWRAGDRRRAVDVARLRGAFAAALDRLGESDRELALQLRTAWVESRRGAGDHLGALAAAWPDPRLREAGVPDIQQAMALGGPAAAQALAYLLNLHGDTKARDAARALVTSQDPALNPARERFLAAFASLAASQAVHDRQLATAAVVSMARNGFPRVLQKSYDSFGKRADRVTVADLPKPRSWPKPVTLSHACEPMAPGDLPVYDAAWIGGRLLLAHGGHGVRLVRTDGHQVARWDVPAHGFSVADSGTRVMLIAVGRQAQEFHQLDLVTRKVRRWAALDVTTVASTYDGGILTVTDEDGIAFLATDEDSPRVLWRELDRRHPVVVFERSQAGISALVRSPGLDGYELWSWNAPAALLRQRPAVALTGMRDAAVLASGHIVALADHNVLVLQNGQWRRPIGTASPDALLMADGDAYAIIDGQRLTLRRDTDPQPLAQLDMPQSVAGLRVTPSRAVLWSEDARVVALDLDRRQVDADFRSAI